MSEQLWQIVAGGRNGILATIEPDGTPQLSNIYYVADTDAERGAPARVVRFSTTSVRTKGRNLLRDPRASLHVPGSDFFNFAVVTARVSIAVRRRLDDAAVEDLFEFHSRLGASSERHGFGDEMLANHRMAVRLQVERIYGQILDRPQ
jgi:PPOX class probable F420-dependent enzyme